MTVRSHLGDLLSNTPSGEPAVLIEHPPKVDHTAIARSRAEEAIGLVERMTARSDGPAEGKRAACSPSRYRGLTLSTERAFSR
jgi:hypothetical protein